jgi:hypothetical protein
LRRGTKSALPDGAETRPRSKSGALWLYCFFHRFRAACREPEGASSHSRRRPVTLFGLTTGRPGAMQRKRAREATRVGALHNVLLTAPELSGDMKPADLLFVLEHLHFDRRHQRRVGAPRRIQRRPQPITPRVFMRRAKSSSCWLFLQVRLPGIYVPASTQVHFSRPTPTPAPKTDSEFKKCP